MNLDGQPFGPREFQLVMLRRMADFQPRLVEEARTRLGAGATDMRAVNAAWQRRMRSPRGSGVGVKDLRQILGTPLADTPRKIGDLPCRVLHWELEVWPELRFEALVGPGGVLVSELLVRPPGAAAPRPATLAELAPWQYVISDVERAFAPVRHVEGSAPGRWTTLVTVGDDRVAVDFVWGLLQEVRELS